MEDIVTKKDVIKLIEVEKQDTFFNHLKYFLIKETIPMGEIGNRKIKVWNPNIWNVGFYPIFEFDFNAQGQLIKISDRLNPASKFFIAVLIIVLISTIGIQIIRTFSFPGSLFFILFIFVFLSIIFFVFYRYYLFEKKAQYEQIFEILDIEYQNEISEKEWSIKNTITRILLYPFSIGILLLAILYMIPNENYVLAIGSFIFFGSYLYIDLKILFKRKNK